MQPLLNKQEWMVQRSQITSARVHGWAEKIACETSNFIIMAFFVLNGFVTCHLPQICISLPFLFCNLLIYCMHIEDKGYR